MSGGAHDSVRPPRPGSPTPPPSDFPVGWPAALWRRGQARRAMRAMVRRNFSNRAHTQVRTVRKRGTERTALAFQRSAQVGIGTTYNGMRRRSAVGAGWESVHIQRSVRWMSRSDGNWGPRFWSTAPAQHPPLLLHQIYPWAGPGLSRGTEGLPMFFRLREDVRN